MAKKLLTVQETAENLRVSRSTIWRWCRDGTLSSAFKVGRTWRIHRTEVEGIIGEESDINRSIQKAVYKDHKKHYVDDG